MALASQTLTWFCSLAMLYWKNFHDFEETVETKIKRKANLQTFVPSYSSDKLWLLSEMST